MTVSTKAVSSKKLLTAPTLRKWAIITSFPETMATAVHSKHSKVVKTWLYSGREGEPSEGYQQQLSEFWGSHSKVGATYSPKFWFWSNTVSVSVGGGTSVTRFFESSSVSRRVSARWLACKCLLCFQACKMEKMSSPGQKRNPVSGHDHRLYSPV
jgi:hypothetical protein